MPRHFTHRSKKKPERLSQRSRGRGTGPLAHPRAPAGNEAERNQELLQHLEHTNSSLRERLAFVAREAEDARHDVGHLAQLFEHTPAGYVVHDQRGYITECNQMAAKLLELTPGKPRGHTLAQFVARTELPRWLEHMRRCARTRKMQSVELTFQFRDGRALPVRLLTQPRRELYEHQADCFYTLILDITARRATEAALRQTQADYRRLIDAIEGIVWEADAHTLDVTFVSSHAERLMGYALSDWQRPGFWLNRIHQADRERVANEILRTVAQRGELRTEYRVLTARRQVLWLHDSIAVVDQGGRLKLLGVALDVTIQHQVQEELLQAQGLLEQRVDERTRELSRTVAELEAFSYSISHDLRAPLRAMLGFAELAVKMGGEQMPPRSKEFIARVIAGAHRADRLVQDLLSYSRVSRANFRLEPVRLEQLVPEILSESPQFQPPQAEVKAQGPLLPVLAHDVVLSQVLTNLLSNAVKFVPPGKVPQVRLWTEPVNGEVRLWVQDNGIGIEPQHLGRIFGIFERIHSAEQFEGTGIGLAIVRKGVERLGGRVGVESAPGKGSAFWIQLKAGNRLEQRANA